MAVSHSDTRSVLGGYWATHFRCEVLEHTVRAVEADWYVFDSYAILGSQRLLVPAAKLWYQ